MYFIQKTCHAFREMINFKEFVEEVLISGELLRFLCISQGHGEIKEVVLSIHAQRLITFISHAST